MADETIQEPGSTGPYSWVISSTTSASSPAMETTDPTNTTIQNLIYSILYSTVSFAAIGGNGVVIYLIINFRRNRRSVTDLFILNLAVGDLLMAILCIPFTFTSNLLFHAWPFGSLMCRLVSYAQAVCVFISAYTLVAISIDRYIAIIYPLRPRMTKRHSQYLVAFIWLVALLTPLPTALLSRLILQSTTIDNGDGSDKINPIAYSIPLNGSSTSGISENEFSPTKLLDGNNNNVSNIDRMLEYFYANSSMGFLLSLKSNTTTNVHQQTNAPTGTTIFHYASHLVKNGQGENETITSTKNLQEFFSSDNVFICQEDWNDNDEYKQTYSVLLMVLQYILPFTVLVFTYSRIGLMIWGQKTPGERDGSRDARIAASKRKMVKMMITCVVAFTLCWLPLNIFIVIGDHYPEIFQYDHIEYVWVACHWLAMSHASYNPFIYIWMNARFRNGFSYVFRRIYCRILSSNVHSRNHQVDGDLITTVDDDPTSHRRMNGSKTNRNFYQCGRVSSFAMSEIVSQSLNKQIRSMSIPSNHLNLVTRSNQLVKTSLSKPTKKRLV